MHEAFSSEIKAIADAARGKGNSVSILSQGGPTPRIPTTSYFSDDDGKTWYIDGNKHVPPYDHNGKTAYRAALYICPNGKPFVQRLEGFDADSKAKIEAEIAAGKPALSAEYAFQGHGMMIKRPGETEWVQLKEGDAEAQIKWGKVMSATCPDGLPSARPVSVEENAQP
ncbi:MAG TPA: hypothetical protein VFE47_12080 [Tepidisphaeraceae bacterium]|nr:hypothetical protein [Tepidisphaeraceae bacterium]